MELLGLAQIANRGHGTPCLTVKVYSVVIIMEDNPMVCGLRMQSLGNKYPTFQRWVDQEIGGNPQLMVEANGLSCVNLWLIATLRLSLSISVIMQLISSPTLNIFFAETFFFVQLSSLE